MPEGNDLTQQLRQLERRVQRERRARLEAEILAERATRDLFDKQRLLLLLQRTATAANESTTLIDALERTIAEVRDYTGWPVGHAYLRRHPDAPVFVPLQRLRAAPITLSATDPFAAFWQQTAQQDFREGEGLPGRVAAAGRPAWIIEVGKEAHFPRARAARAVGLHAAFGFPVLSGRQVEAVLEFFSPEVAEPDEMLLGAMEAIGAQLGRVAERERHAEQLEASNRELQDFAYVASHDLQEPLRKIHTFAELLDTTYGAHMDAESRHFLDRIQHAARRMSRLIHDLLALSRVATTEHRLVSVNLNETLQEVLADLETRLAEAQGRVEVPRPLPTVCADPTHMHQLLLNLVGNALKFLRPGTPPRVTVEAGRRDGLVWIAVEDNGIGFDQTQAGRIFRPFQRLHTRAEYEGTGIGLALVRRIAERHGGTAEATSTPGAGSRFVITLGGPEVC